jgi:hypothetical protein
MQLDVSAPAPPAEVSSVPVGNQPEASVHFPSGIGRRFRRAPVPTLEATLLRRIRALTHVDDSAMLLFGMWPISNAGGHTASAFSNKDADRWTMMRLGR